MGPQHAIVGNSASGAAASSPLAMPKTQVPDELVTQAQGMTTFSKTDEWNKLKTYIEDRIAAYEAQFKPGIGSEAAQLPNEERGWRWLHADATVTELRAIITTYDEAAKLVAEAEKKAADEVKAHA